MRTWRGVGAALAVVGSLTLGVLFLDSPVLGSPAVGSPTLGRWVAVAAAAPSAAVHPRSTGRVWTRISAGSDHTCAIDDAGRGWCWGSGATGQLGTGSTTRQLLPVPVDLSTLAAGTTLTAISAGYSHTCALDASGHALCWGWDDWGQLGNADTATTLRPVLVTRSGALAGRTLTRITAGWVHTCALDRAGRAYCWGSNDSGELGSGSRADRSLVPVPVDRSGVLSGVHLAQISAGFDHTCALSRAGRAYCWGANLAGQLGHSGPPWYRNRPMAVDRSGVLAGVRLTRISVGWNHSCALSRSGHAYCWGYNQYGQLGGVRGVSRGRPVAVDSTGALAGVRLNRLSGGGNFTCALSRRGRAYCWGTNAAGELGNGTTTRRQRHPSAVVREGVLAGVRLASIGAGGGHTCAVDRVGRAYCWGDNASGQLGTGSRKSHSVPVRLDQPAR